jgi:hypothetical protein
MNDETLYVAPSSKHTDYSQPPLNNFYYGVLNTGRRRYAHPALSGSLPTPWLPQPERERKFGDGAKERRGVVLSLRRKLGRKEAKNRRRSEGSNGLGGEDGANGAADGGEVPSDWATGWDGRDAAQDRDAAASDENGWGGVSGGYGVDADQNADDQGGMSGSRTSNGSTSSTMNPWATSSFDNARATKSQSMGKHAAAGGSGKGEMRISMPSEQNVWGDEESDEGDADGQGGGGTTGRVASPVS